MTAFVDSNILLYATSVVPEEAVRTRISQDILDHRQCTLSLQVLNEFVWQATHSRRVDRLSFERAWEFVAAWRRHRVQPLDLAVFDLACDVGRETNYTWWDCLIVAAAQASGCDVLLTEDMHHGHRIGGVRIENPFRDLG